MTFLDHQLLYEGNTNQRVLLPDDCFMLVRIRVVVSFYLTCLTSEETMQIRTGLVAFAGVEGVTLRAAGLK